MAFVAAVVLLALLAQGCGAVDGFRSHREAMRAMHGDGRDSRSETVVDAAGVTTVEIRDFAFTPGNLRVSAGSEVTFVNRDGVVHTATDEGGSWDTGLLGTDEAGRVRFDRPGEYEYRCLPHPEMRARITVVEA